MGIETGRLELNAAGHAQGIPQSLEARFTGVTVDPPILPAALPAPLQGSVKLNWNAASGNLDINALQLSSGALGVLSVSAHLSGVSADLFSADEAARMSALLGLSLVDASGSLQDNGLVAALLADRADAQIKSAEDARIEAAALSRIALPVLLSSLPDADTITGRIAAFIKTPGSVSFSIKGRNGPLGIADFIAAEGPADVLRTLAISITDQ